MLTRRDDVIKDVESILKFKTLYEQWFSFFEIDTKLPPTSNNVNKLQQKK